MTTTFDGSGATINQATMTRVVCANTLQASLFDKRAIIRTRHSTKFNAEKVSKELAAVAQGFAQYKKMAEAMAQVRLSAEQTEAFFRKLLDVDANATADDISGRKRNQLSALDQAYDATRKEGVGANAWAALNAVTRYVDHDKLGRGGEEGRVISATMGSGAGLKLRAFDILSEMADA